MVTILLVEVEEPIRSLLTTILRGIGNIFAVDSGQAALDLCSQLRGSIDVLITDLLEMHPTDGIQLSRMLLQRYPKLQIIIVSAYGREALARYVPVPKHLFIQKPFSGAYLRNGIEEALAGRNAFATPKQGDPGETLHVKSDER